MDIVQHCQHGKYSHSIAKAATSAPVAADHLYCECGFNYKLTYTFAVSYAYRA